MASTSTGYHEPLITKERPSSSGQVMRFSSGCMLVLNNDAKVEMESGSTFVIESGGVLRNENAAEPTKKSTKLSAHGVSYFTTGGLYYLQPVKGARKTLINFSTEIVNIAAGTSADACRFGTSKESNLGINGALAPKPYMGISVDLYAVGNSTWFVLLQSSAAPASIASASSSLAT